MAKQKIDKKELAVVNQLEEKASTLSTITTEEELHQAIDVTLLIRKKFNEEDQKRTARTAPLNESLKLINQDYSHLKVLASLEKQLKEEIELFATKKIWKDIEKLNAIREESGDKTLTIPLGFQSIAGSAGEIRFRKSFRINIVDESKVPKKYKTVDIKAIQKEVDALEGEIKIAGVEIIPVSTTALYVR